MLHRIPIARELDPLAIRLISSQPASATTSTGQADSAHSRPRVGRIMSKAAEISLVIGAALPLVLASDANANDLSCDNGTIEIPISLDDSQIDVGSGGIDDDWVGPMIDRFPPSQANGDPGDEVVAIGNEKMCTFHFVFEDMKHLEMKQTEADDEDEAIVISILGASGIGIAETASFLWAFSDENGDVVSGDIVQSVIGEPADNVPDLLIGADTGNAGIDLDINIVEKARDDTLVFHDVELKLTNNSETNTWRIDKISIGVSADEVSIGEWAPVPEPSVTLLMGVTALALRVATRRTRA